jgi:hypothetical protein
MRGCCIFVAPFHNDYFICISKTNQFLMKTELIKKIINYNIYLE